MSDHEEERPLTRRERRLQEMAATGALDLSELAERSAGQPTPVEASTDSADASIAEEIEISPVNEDGTPRSRREMRQLREEALARLEASRASAAEASAPAAEEPVAEEPASEEPVAEEPAAEEPAAAVESDAAEPEVAESVAAAESDPETPEVEAVEPEAPADDADAPSEDAEEPGAETVAFDASELADAESATPAVESAPEEGVDFDTLISPPTEAFTVEELAEAESAGSSGTADSAAVDAEPIVAVPVVETPAVAETPLDDAAPAEEAAPAEGARSKLRFPWKRNKSEDGAATAGGDAVEAEAVLAEATPDAAAVEAEPAAVEAEIIAEPAPVEAEAAPEAVAADPAPASPETPQTYSFPDIAPPEEWRSVFDDPTPRKLPGQKGDGDFDDLISRAVAQESTASSNTSALILPTMPEDTGGLAGPLGATGDLYVTGSLKLPKSLGETGGHAALHDSVEVDPISGMPDDDPHVTAEQTGLAPVAARHAVSAQVTSSIPVVAKPVKERNKLPLVLSLTGGGLLVVVAGIGVVGATQGWFG